MCKPLIDRIANRVNIIGPELPPTAFTHPAGTKELLYDPNSITAPPPLSGGGKKGNLKRGNSLFRYNKAKSRLLELIIDVVRDGSRISWALISQVHIEGRLCARSCDKDREKRFVTEIAALRVPFLGPKPQGGVANCERPTTAIFPF